MRIIAIVAILIILVFGGYLLLDDHIQPMQVHVMVPTLPPLYIGIIPYLAPEQLKLEIGPVLEYLGKKLGRPVQLVTSGDYRSLAQLLELGRLHITWFSHASYLQLRGDHSWEVICRPEQHGKIVYDGEIVTRKDAEIYSLEDLRGKTFAFVDRFSGSGFFFPNQLFQTMGIRPLEYFKSVKFTQNHKTSIDGVLSGEFDGAAVFSTFERADKLRYLATTGPIPNDPLVVRQDLQPELKARLRHLLLTMHEDPLGKTYMQMLEARRGTTRFVSEEEFQSIVAGLTQKEQSEPPVQSN